MSALVCYVAKDFSPKTVFWNKDKHFRKMCVCDKSRGVNICFQNFVHHIEMCCYSTCTGLHTLKLNVTTINTLILLYLKGKTVEYLQHKHFSKWVFLVRNVVRLKTATARDGHVCSRNTSCAKQMCIDYFWCQSSVLQESTTVQQSVIEYDKNSHGSVSKQQLVKSCRKTLGLVL